MESLRYSSSEDVNRNIHRLCNLEISFKKFHNPKNKSFNLKKDIKSRCLSSHIVEYSSYYKKFKELENYWQEIKDQITLKRCKTRAFRKSCYLQDKNSLQFFKESNLYRQNSCTRIYNNQLKK